MPSPTVMFTRASGLTWLLLVAIAAWSTLSLSPLLSAALLNRALLDVMRTPDSLKTTPQFVDAAHVQPSSPRANYYVGWQRYLTGDYAQSVRALTSAFAQSHDPLTGLRLGLAYDSAGNKTDALDVWRQAHSENYFLSRARFSLTHADANAAYSDGALALHITPDSADARFVMARALQQKGQHSDALRLLFEAYTLAPKSFEVAQAIVESYVAEKNFAAAADWDERSATLVRASEALLFRGRAALWREQYPAAISELTTYVQNVPDNEYAYGLLCLTYRATRDYENAAAMCVKRIAQGDPPHAAWYVELGDVYRAARNASAARQAYEHALRLEPDNAKALAGMQAVSP